MMLKTVAWATVGRTCIAIERDLWDGVEFVVRVRDGGLSSGSERFHTEADARSRANEIWTMAQAE